MAEGKSFFDFFRGNDVLFLLLVIIIIFFAAGAVDYY